MELAVSRLVLDTLQSSSNTISKGQQHVEHFSHQHPLNDFSWILFYDSKKKSCPANRTTLRPKLQCYSWEMMATISCPANSSWHFNFPLYCIRSTWLYLNTELYETMRPLMKSFIPSKLSNHRSAKKYINILTSSNLNHPKLILQNQNVHLNIFWKYMK